MPGRDQKLRAGARRGDELPLAQHRAGADDRAFHLAGDRFDRIDRGAGAQRDLDHLQSAGDERAGERHGIRHVVEDDDGNDRRGADDRLKLFAAAHPFPPKAHHAGALLRRGESARSRRRTRFVAARSAAARSRASHYSTPTSASSVPAAGVKPDHVAVAYLCNGAARLSPRV